MLPVGLTYTPGAPRTHKVKKGQYRCLNLMEVWTFYLLGISENLSLIVDLFPYFRFYFRLNMPGSPAKHKKKEEGNGESGRQEVLTQKNFKF